MRLVHSFNNHPLALPFALNLVDSNSNYNPCCLVYLYCSMMAVANNEMLTSSVLPYAAAHHAAHTHHHHHYTSSISPFNTSQGVGVATASNMYKNYAAKNSQGIGLY